MDVDGLKIELLKKIIACKDEAVLKKIEALLEEKQIEAREPGESYNFEKESALSKEQLEEIEKRSREYANGELKTESLETFNQKIFEKYGF
ncbi:hypothetical protein SAMN05444483_10257 [Salegentibacter echinorum]|uniref:Addiction module component n=1 Tax=Salegentibacter echinorum TaxID=1073325 RepID=A0A1M5DPZ3_SALEC|nr:hypothetical protein [Salegentibacter echinorum]SHF68911.1 hypothetical protein SAMN05444483_10257 [Salegentibacter echinorum]